MDFLSVLLSQGLECPMGPSALGLVGDVFIVASLIPFNYYRWW